MDHFTDISRIMLSDVDHVRKSYLLRTFSLRLYSAPLVQTQIALSISTCANRTERRST